MSKGQLLYTLARIRDFCKGSALVETANVTCIYPEMSIFRETTSIGLPFCRKSLYQSPFEQRTAFPSSRIMTPSRNIEEAIGPWQHQHLAYLNVLLPVYSHSQGTASFLKSAFFIPFVITLQSLRNVKAL